MIPFLFLLSLILLPVQAGRNYLFTSGTAPEWKDYCAELSADACWSFYTQWRPPFPDDMTDYTNATAPRSYSGVWLPVNEIPGWDECFSPLATQKIIRVIFADNTLTPLLGINEVTVDGPGYVTGLLGVTTTIAEKFNAEVHLCVTNFNRSSQKITALIVALIVIGVVIVLCFLAVCFNKFCRRRNLVLVHNHFDEELTKERVISTEVSESEYRQMKDEEKREKEEQEEVLAQQALEQYAVKERQRETHLLGSPAERRSITEKEKRQKNAELLARLDDELIGSGEAQRILQRSQERRASDLVGDV